MKYFNAQFEHAWKVPILQELYRVSSDQNLIRKNAKIFGHISQTTSHFLEY